MFFEAIIDDGLCTTHTTRRTSKDFNSSPWANDSEELNIPTVFWVKIWRFLLTDNIKTNGWTEGHTVYFVSGTGGGATPNRKCLGQFREIPWNQTTDVYRGSTLIPRAITWNWRYISWRWRHGHHANIITIVIAANKRLKWRLCFFNET